MFGEIIAMRYWKEMRPLVGLSWRIAGVNSIATLADTGLEMSG
jgi:hypothetical protein